MTITTCTRSHVNAAPTGACTACQEHQVEDQVMLWQCLASYADSHDEQQASAVLGDQSRLHTGRQADLAYVLWAERWIGHLSQVLPFIVVWSGQNVVVRSSLHDIKLLRVHVHASVLPVLLVKGLQRSKTFGAKLAELAVGFECHADSA